MDVCICVCAIWWKHGTAIKNNNKNKKYSVFLYAISLSNPNFFLVWQKKKKKKNLSFGHFSLMYVTIHGLSHKHWIPFHEAVTTETINKTNRKSRRKKTIQRKKRRKKTTKSTIAGYARAGVSPSEKWWWWNNTKGEDEWIWAGCGYIVKMKGYQWQQQQQENELKMYCALTHNLFLKENGFSHLLVVFFFLLLLLLGCPLSLVVFVVFFLL